MRRLGILALLVAVAAGCGGSGKQENTIPLQLSKLPRSTTCVKKGISTRAGRAGTCVARGTRITVANRNGELAMKGYSVRLVGLRRAKNLGSRASSNFTPDGKFVVATLRVTNSGSKPLRFDRAANLGYLLAGGTEYQEVPGAENEVRDSFPVHGPTIDPGKSASGTLVFDPPASQARKAGVKGSYLVFLSPEDAGNGLPRLGTPAIGLIRLSS
jgi:Domain of unknown function (DUF4352)